MIQIKRTRYLSGKVIASFGPQAKREWKEMRSIRRSFYDMVTRLWVLYHNNTPVCVLGIKRESLCGSGGEVFFLLCKQHPGSITNLLRFLKRGTRRILALWGRLVVRVENDFWIGKRFVSHFGFREYYVDTNHTVYQLRLQWLR